jgi:hypothetical protein
VSRDYDFRDNKFEQITQAMGQLAFVWNDLGMVLSSLFHAATRIPNGLAADAIWNSVSSDRMQREMIVSLIKFNGIGYRIPKELRDEILWCLTEVNKLEELRNNAIHAPVLVKDDQSLVAWHHLGNRRAKQLAEKDLLKEFRWFYETTLVLRQYCEHLAICLRANEIPQEIRPRLPTRGK